MTNSRDIIKDIKLMADYTDVSEFRFLESERTVDGLPQPALVVISYDEDGRQEAQEVFVLVKVEE